VLLVVVEEKIMRLRELFASLCWFFDFSTVSNTQIFVAKLFHKAENSICIIAVPLCPLLLNFKQDIGVIFFDSTFCPFQHK